jgi:hypothetical protein
MAKYGPKSKEEVGKAMHEFKEGTLKSGAHQGRRSRIQNKPSLLASPRPARKAAKCPPRKAEHDFPQLFRLPFSREAISIGTRQAAQGQ